MSDNDIKIEIMEDGPLIVKGLKTFKNSKGEQVEVDDVIALCRCGDSANKPFCDGTHKKVGFSGKREIDKPIDKEREYEGSQISVFDNRVICSHAAECVKKLDKPCIAFKIMGAGRIDPVMAFEFAFENIKPDDVVNVGMHRGDNDNMVEENVAHVSKILAGE